MEQGDSFRPEFVGAIENMKELLNISLRNNPHLKIPFLAMSATFRIPEQIAFNTLIGREPDLVNWGPMDKRNVGIHVQIAGDPLHLLMKDWMAHMNKDPSAQSLLYSNSAKACDETLLNKLEAACKTMPASIRETLDGTAKEFLALTGECGVMLKSYLMAAYCGEEGIIDFDFPFVWCMPCTSAANCGVSSKRCTKCYRYGPCPNWQDLVQEMGRVDRLHRATRGTNAYYLYLNVVTFLSLWVRANHEQNEKVRHRYVDQLMEVLRFLVLPNKCYHEAIEEHFENPSTNQSRGGCGGMCCRTTRRSRC